MIIVIEGSDSSGKKTQCLMLHAALKSRFPERRVEQLSFPDYKTPVGQEIGFFLRKNQKDYPQQFFNLLQVANRWEKIWLLNRYNGRDNKDLLILDRYSESNIVYGRARGLDIEWLQSIEFGLPKSDLVIVLDVDVVKAAERDKKEKDVNEADLQYQKDVREQYLKLAQKFGWSVVNGDGDLGEVHERVLAEVVKEIGPGLGPGVTRSPEQASAWQRAVDER